MNNQPAIRFLDRSTPPHIFTLIMLAGLSAMVMNVFLPSLPHMATHFDTEYSVVQLSVALYLMCSAVLQLVIGPISDNIGRRPVLLGGMLLFLVATVGCIYAPNITVFLIFRMAQAVAAVSMVLSRAVIRDLYEQDRAASMIGYVTMGMAVAPMISPAIGGFLDAWLGWQATFWFMIIFGIIVVTLVFFDQGETARASGKSLSAQFREYPELLRSPRFWGYAAAAGLCAGAFFAYLGGAPFVGSVVFEMDPATLGLFFGAPAIGYFTGNFITGRFATRLGIDRLVLWGCCINLFGASGTLAIFFLGLGSPLTFFGMMCFIGLGNGLCIPNATAGMLSVRPHLAGTASGLGGAIMIGGGAALSALAGALLTPQTGAYPVLWLMFFTAVGSVIAILLVLRRNRILGVEE